MEEGKICLNCNGVGWHTCATCNGSGTVKKLIIPEYGKETEATVNCPWCLGRGIKKCGCCDGKGIITEEDKKKNEIFLRKIKKYITGKVAY